MNSDVLQLLQLKLPQPADISSIVTYVEARQALIEKLQKEFLTSESLVQLSDEQWLQIETLGAHAMREAQHMLQHLLKDLQKVQLHRQQMTYHQASSMSYGLCYLKA